MKIILLRSVHIVMELAKCLLPQIRVPLMKDAPSVLALDRFVSGGNYDRKI